MPFENVHGNGGLLTTVGDLLKWNDNFASHVGRRRGVARRAGDAPGSSTTAACISTRSGLMVGPYKGVRQIAHSGSTAGYQALSDAVSGPAGVGRRPVQRQQRAATAYSRCGRGHLSGGSHQAGAAEGDARA